jgi:hypothetical protein
VARAYAQQHRNQRDPARCAPCPHRTQQRGSPITPLAVGQTITGRLYLGSAGLDVLVHAAANGEASFGRAAQVGSRLATTAATAVVIGTEATSPMLPTSVRTISVATSWVVTTSPSARPEMLKISISGSEAPA